MPDASLSRMIIDDYLITHQVLYDQNDSVALLVNPILPLDQRLLQNELSLLVLLVLVVSSNVGPAHWLPPSADGTKDITDRMHASCQAFALLFSPYYISPT